MTDKPPPPKPRYLTPEELLAAWEKLAAAGYLAGKIRLDMLRRNMAEPKEPTP